MQRRESKAKKTVEEIRGELRNLDNDIIVANSSFCYLRHRMHHFYVVGGNASGAVVSSCGDGKSRAEEKFVDDTRM